MKTVELKPISELLPQVEQVLARIFRELSNLVPEGNLHHIGATALPGAVTKGDVDVLVQVTPAVFSQAVEAIRRRFEVRQPANWTPDFASFGDDTSYGMPLGIQVVVKDSSSDYLLFLRDYLLANADALQEYNRLRLDHAAEGPEGYGRAKDKFLSRIMELKTKGVA